MVKRLKAQKSNFIIGRPWEPTNPESSICTYAYGREVQFGTLGEAIGFRDFCNSQGNDKFRIYQVVEVPGSQDFTKDDI